MVFSDPGFYATVQKFRLLHYVILLHAKVLNMTLKGLLINSFQWSSFLVKAFLRKKQKFEVLSGTEMYYFTILFGGNPNIVW